MDCLEWILRYCTLKIRNVYNFWLWNLKVYIWNVSALLNVFVFAHSDWNIHVDDSNENIKWHSHLLLWFTFINGRCFHIFLLKLYEKKTLHIQKQRKEEKRCSGNQDIHWNILFIAKFYVNVVPVFVLMQVNVLRAHVFFFWFVDEYYSFCLYNTFRALWLCFVSFYLFNYSLFFPISWGEQKKIKLQNSGVNKFVFFKKCLVLILS